MFVEQQNFTKEYAINYFQNNNNKTTLSLDYTFPETTIRVLLKKELDSEKKKIYNFFIFVDGECVYENKKKKNKGDSFDEVFSFLYKLPEYKLYKKKNNLEIPKFNIEEFVNNFGYLVEEEVTHNVFEDKENLTREELNNYLIKAFEDKKVQEKILELREINNYILNIEKTRNQLKEIPEKLFEIALRGKWTVSKLEKVLINKAKKVIIKCYLENISLVNDYIKEFDIRFFDYNIYGETSPSKYATEETRRVTKDRNLFRLVELESKNPKNQFANIGHNGKWEVDKSLSTEKTLVFNYITYNKGKLELDLGWDYLDIINYLVLKMKESIYFFRPEQQEKKISLDTYLISVIRNALMTLRNYTSKVDNSGRIRRWKDDLIIKKLKEIKYAFDEAKYTTIDPLKKAQYEFNVDNVVNALKEYNETIKDQWAKITRKDVEEFINNLTIEEISIDKLIEWDDGEIENQNILSDVWQSDGVGSWYDTQTVVEKKFKQEKLSDIFWQIFSSNEEKVALEFILDNFSNLTSWSSTAIKKAIKVDSVEFNKIFTTLGEKEVTQTQLDWIIENMINKILINRDLFQRVLFEWEDDKFIFTKKETLSDFNEFII